MTDLSSPQAAVDAHAVRSRVAQVFSALSVPSARIERELLSEADTAALLRACPWPRRVLLVGGGGGFLAATLGLLYPDAEVTCIDPDLPLDPELAAGMRAAQPAAQPLTDQRLARAAARQLGIDGRLEFIPGGFAEAETSRSSLDRGKVRIVGVDVCARLQPIDLVMVAGLATPEARAADIRLAASALAADGVIATRGVIGAPGATVRAGVFEFLRYYPDFAFLHARHVSHDESLGFLKRRQAGWPASFQPIAAGRLEDAAGARETMADLAAVAVGGRPVLEAAVGEPVLDGVSRDRGLQSRTLRLSATDWSTHFFDPIIEDLIEALGQKSDSVLFSGDLLDHAPDEFIGRLFARLADRGAPGLFFATPPGERDVAGPMSRPVSRILDIAAGQGLSAYAPAALEFERARHEGSFRHGGLGSNSRAASLVLLGQAGGFRDARGRRLAELTTAAASAREQVELQRIHSEAGAGQRFSTLAGLRREPEMETRSLRDRERTASTLRSHERSLEELQAELDRLRAEAAAYAPPLRDADTFRPGDLSRRELSDRLRVDMDALSQAERARYERDLEDAMARERTLREGLQARSGEAVRAQEEMGRLSSLLATAESRRDLAERQRQDLEITLQAERAKSERLVSDAGLRERAMRDMMQSRESELERAEDQVSRLSSLLATSDARRELAERQRKELEAAHIAERLRAEREYQELTAREREARELLEARLAEMADHGQKSSLLSTQLSEAQGRHASAEGQLAELAAKHEQALKEAEAKLAELTVRHDEALTAAESHAQSLTAAQARVQELDYRLKARDAEVEALTAAQKTAEALLVKAQEDLKAAEAAQRGHGEERERFNRELGLLSVRAEAAEKRPQLDPEVMARLESKIQALATQRDDERLVRSQLEAAQRDLADLRERSTRLSALVQERDLLIEQLQHELHHENLAAVETSCRESDTRVSLEGVSSHIALAQSALDRFREAPETFGSETIAYPGRAPAALEEDLSQAAKSLHGQAADVSQELARQLAQVANERQQFEAWKSDHYRVSERAHIEALDQTLHTFRAEHTDTVMDEVRLRDALEHAEDLLERIYGRVFKDHLAEVAEFLEPAPAEALGVADRIVLHERRLAHLLHAVDATLGVRHGEAINYGEDVQAQGQTLRGLMAPVAAPAPVMERPVEPPVERVAERAAPVVAAPAVAPVEPPPPAPPPVATATATVVPFVTETPPSPTPAPVAPVVEAEELFDFEEVEPDLDEGEELDIELDDDETPAEPVVTAPMPDIVQTPVREFARDVVREPVKEAAKEPVREPERRRDVFAPTGGQGRTAQFQDAIRGAEPAKNPFARPRVVPLSPPQKPEGDAAKAPKDRLGRIVGAVTARAPGLGGAAAAGAAAKDAGKDTSKVAGKIVGKDAKPSIKLEPAKPAAPKGPIFKRLWARAATYPEMLRIVQLQKQLKAQFITKGMTPRAFDAEYYAATGGYEPYDEPLHHYLMEGEDEGRWPLAGFDPDYYAQRVGDLSDWNGSLLRHFLAKGVHQGIPPSEGLKRIAEDARAVRASPLEYFFQWEAAERKLRRGGSGEGEKS